MTHDTTLQSQQPAPQPGPEHKRLRVFIGKWITEGNTVAPPARHPIVSRPAMCTNGCLANSLCYIPPMVALATWMLLARKSWDTTTRLGHIFRAATIAAAPCMTLT
jgi:hypothetical protein